MEGHNLLDLMYSDIHQWLKVFQSYVQFTRLKVQTTPPKDSNTRVQMFERFVESVKRKFTSFVLNLPMDCQFFFLVTLSSCISYLSRQI